VKRHLLWVIVVIGVHEAFCQWEPGIGFSFGYSEEAKHGPTIDYFHPLPIRQCYVVCGYSYSNAGVSPPAEWLKSDLGLHILNGDWLQPIPLSELHRFFAGVQIGDNVYALPRISYNIYGDYASIGWGFVGGFCVHPSRRIALGASIAYDRLRYDDTLDIFGPVGLLSAHLNVLFKFPR
jgi:hypothetical protein